MRTRVVFASHEMSGEARRALETWRGIPEGAIVDSLRPADLGPFTVDGLRPYDCGVPSEGTGAEARLHDADPPSSSDRFAVWTSDPGCCTARLVSTSGSLATTTQMSNISPVTGGSTGRTTDAGAFEAHRGDDAPPRTTAKNDRGILSTASQEQISPPTGPRPNAGTVRLWTGDLRVPNAPPDRDSDHDGRDLARELIGQLANVHVLDDPPDGRPLSVAECVCHQTEGVIDAPCRHPAAEGHTWRVCVVLELEPEAPRLTDEWSQNRGSARFLDMPPIAGSMPCLPMRVSGAER